jgi:hypothetical protein
MPVDAVTQSRPQFVSARLYELRSQMTAGKIQDDDGRMTLLQRLLKYHPNAAAHECMSDQDIISEGMGHTYVCQFGSNPCSDCVTLGSPA